MTMEIDVATFDARLPQNANYFIGLRSAYRDELMVGGRFDVMPKQGDTVIAENGEPFFFVEVIASQPKGSFVATIKRYGGESENG